MKERNPNGNDTSPDRMRMPEIFLASNVLKKKIIRSRIILHCKHSLR